MEILASEVHSDPDVGLVVLAYAATVAPNLDGLVDPARARAVAILRRVAAGLPEPGMARVLQQSRNGTSVSFRDIGSAFSSDDRAALRALAGGPASSPAAPVGSFPASGVVAALWPEAES